MGVRAQVEQETKAWVLEFQSNLSELERALKARAEEAKAPTGTGATAGAEYGDFYPWYHTTADTIGNLSMPLAAEVAHKTNHGDTEDTEKKYTEKSWSE